MAADRQNYLGINRAISDFSPSGACEELINLRPTTDGLVPVKPFTTLCASVVSGIEKVFVHNAPGGVRYWGLGRTTGGTNIYLFTNDWGTLHKKNISGVTPDEVFFAYAGNIVVFSTKAALENYAWRLEGSNYTEIEANIPTITAGFSDEAFWAETANPVVMQDNSPDVCRGVISSSLNEIQESHPEACFGGIIVAIAFKTKDGHTFWTNQWLYYEPTDKVNNTYSAQTEQFFHVQGTDFPTEAEQEVVAPFYDNHDYGYLLWATDDNISGSQVRCAGTKVKLRLRRGSWDNETSMIQSVEIYCSKPELYLDFTDPLYSGNFTGPGEEEGETESFSFSAALATERERKDMGLDDKLLYYQASVPLANIPTSDYTEVELHFGGNIQLTNRTLDVDAGAVTHYGNMLAYNSRFHFYDSKRKELIGTPSFAVNDSGISPSSYPVFVRYSSGTLYYLGQKPTGSGETIIIAPSQEIAEVAVYHPSDYPSYVAVYRMTTSQRYNYSIHIGASDARLYSADYGEYYDLYSHSAITTYRTEDEKAAINVTEQYNPFVFKVEHSYLAPAAVSDLQPQMAGMTDTSYGTYPLNVFTPKGVYALMQGTGTVLYSHFRQLANIVSTSNSVPTGSGTFIIGSRGLWLIAGARAILVSDALHLGPHKYIRASDGYKHLSGPSVTHTPAQEGDYTAYYDVSDLVSQVTFLEYLEGNQTVSSKATLSYNRFHDELYISNPGYKYTYALSLKYRQWFKLDRALHQDSIGGNILLTPSTTTANTMAILDLSAETPTNEILVHLQSRPFSYGYMYSHVHRLVSLIRAKLTTANNKLAAALYGSDNLQDWKLICYATRKIPTGSASLKFSQVRTSSASRSWRYYTVCIGGIIPDDTDFGPVLVDYQPVIRRIG